MRFSKQQSLLALLIMVIAVTVAAERIVVEAIMVRVNDRVISVTDFSVRMRQELSQLPELPQDDQMAEFAEALLEAVVQELVLLERADQKQVEVSSEAIDQAIETLRQENSLQTEEEFEQALSQAGLTIEALRRRYTQSMLLQRTVQSEIQSTEITQEEIRQIYEREKENFKVPASIELAQLFFPFAEDESDRNAVIARVEGMLVRVRSGADLTAEATLAGVALQDLGAIPEEDLRDELRNALIDLGDGELTDPIGTVGGVQVLRLVRRIPAGYQPFEELRDRIHRVESDRRYQEQASGFVENLKREYLVEVHQELLPQAIERIANADG
ncbi:MAG: hypothetical protein GY906_34835 [bacterium]|nr:hypothetical protein [bacterium]